MNSESSQPGGVTSGDPHRGLLQRILTKAIADGGGAMLGGAVGAAQGGVVGGAVGGLVGGLATPALAWVAEFDRRSADLAEDMVDNAREAAGMTAAELGSWASSDEHLRVLVGLIEAGWRTRDRDKLSALSAALFDVLLNEAHLDIVGLLAEAWRDIEAPHVKVVAFMARGEADVRTTAPKLAEALPALAVGMPALLAVLQRTGCIRSVNAFLGNEVPWELTDFGRLLLTYVLRGQPPTPNAPETTAE